MDDEKNKQEEEAQGIKVPGCTDPIAGLILA